jgi:hypothetical protein
VGPAQRSRQLATIAEKRLRSAAGR